MRRKRRHRPSLKAALRQSSQAGAIPTSATIAPDGTVVIGFGRRDEVEKRPENELDEWKAKHAN